MSLGKLLATGRSLIGGAPGEGRYNISNVNRLPKFGSKQNPFAPSATSEARVAMAATEESAGVRLEQPLSPARSPSEGERETNSIVCAPSVQHEETQRIPELADQPFGRVESSALAVAGPNRLKAGLRAGARLLMVGLKNFWRIARAAAVAAVAAACRFKWGSRLMALGGQVRRAGPLVRRVWTKMKAISIKLAGLFRKREPKSAIPRFGKPAEQTLLSLDRVQVVRNSLEDSDLEVVTAETATSTQVVPTTPVASPKRGPVPLALKKMTERLLGVPALD